MCINVKDKILNNYSNMVYHPTQELKWTREQTYHSILYLKQKIKHHWNNEWKTLAKTTTANHQKWLLQERNTHPL